MRLKKYVPQTLKKQYRRVRGRLTKRQAPAGVPALYNIDSPVRQRADRRTISVEGWIIPQAGHALRGLRLTYGGKVQDVPSGMKRVDVSKAFPNEPGALQSGFRVEVATVNDTLYLEADLGGGYKEIYSLDITYSPELSVKDVYNPSLAQNYAEHLNLSENHKRYYFEDPLEGVYERHADDPRLIAFYLPQYHPIPENDKVWGKGFTEWTNASSGQPRFVGHRQPILPRDLGFYDLRREDVMKDQVELAKKYGIYGFCFYYYWFSGKRILEAPVDSFLRRKEWDFNFSICWANENWTKRWDGRDSEVIIEQEYRKEDPLAFIKDVEGILLDPRYIQEDGKPVLTVFRASELKDPAEYARVWREYFRKRHNRELHLVSIISFEDKDPAEYGFDKAIDFAPQSSFFKNEIFQHGKYPTIDMSQKLIDVNYEGTVTNYRDVALNAKGYDFFPFETYKCVTPAWDNDARKKGKGFVMMRESPDIYAKWLDGVLAHETRKKAPLLFINAWNEWAEGAILEPSQHYGSAVLNRTVESLARHSKNAVNAKELPAWGIHRTPGARLAVVVHLYYPESWDLIKKRLSALDGEKYDLFVSLNIKDSDFAKAITSFKRNATIKIVPNRGRDVLPFINLLPKLSAAGYKYVLKLHSKKTTHRSNGAEWLPDLLDKLLSNERDVRKILERLEQTPAIVGPEGHFVSLDRYMGSNEAHLRTLLSAMHGDAKAGKVIDDKQAYGYFAGSMFWASLASLKPLEDIYLLPEEFESEQGQIDGTLAHAVERVVSLLPAFSADGELWSAAKGTLKKVKYAEATTTYPYAN